VLDQIGKIFGQTALQIVTGVVAFYYALTAVARIRDVYFGAGENRCAKARKAHLETLKLEAEIAACRKTAGLEPLTTEQLNLPTPPLTIYPLTRLANFVWSQGSVAKFFFGVITAVLQLFGWLALAFLLVATRYWIIMRSRNSHFQITSLEGYVLAAVILIGGGMLYLGFAVFGRILRADHPTLHRVLCAVVVVVALVLSILLWFSQNEDLYPGSSG